MGYWAPDALRAPLWAFWQILPRSQWPHVFLPESKVGSVSSGLKSEIWRQRKRWYCWYYTWSGDVCCKMMADCVTDTKSEDVIIPAWLKEGMRNKSKRSQRNRADRTDSWAKKTVSEMERLGGGMGGWGCGWHWAQLRPAGQAQKDRKHKSWIRYERINDMTNNYYKCLPPIFVHFLEQSLGMEILTKVIKMTNEHALAQQFYSRNLWLAHLQIKISVCMQVSLKCHL